MKFSKLFLTTVLFISIAVSVAASPRQKPAVGIKLYHSEPFSMARPETDILWGPNDGEFLELRIDGEIRNFSHIVGKYDWDTGEITDEIILNHLYRVADCVIVVSTNLPAGIPTEKLRWSDSDGNIYEFVIKADPYGNDSWMISPEKH